LMLPRTAMKPPLDPDCVDLAPSDPSLTRYDQEHLITYLRMLDANADGADWREVSRIVLHIDAERELDRARRAFDSRLARAKWMTEVGYRRLLRWDCGERSALTRRPDEGRPHYSEWL
jgi:hypothetical protein